MSKHNGSTVVSNEYNFPQKKEPLGFKKTIYNNADGTYFGRTLESWGKIVFFYIIFYIVLAAFVAICMQGLLATLNDQHPRWQLEKSIIGTNPGMGFRPVGNDTGERGAVIQFDTQKPKEGEHWISEIDEFLEQYNKSVGTKKKFCNFNETHNPQQVCAVNMDKFGPCTRNNSYGYKNGRPCVFLKLNKIYNWDPEYYDTLKELPDEMPQSLKNHISNTTELERQQIWISCQGVHSQDKENLGEIKIYPDPGFPAYYYPYLNQKGYLSPLIAVQFLNIKVGEMVSIECRAWAHNIIYSGRMRDRQGSVAFHILVD